MSWFDRLLDRFLDWREQRQLQRQCFHHDWLTGQTWVQSMLVDVGRAKHFRCSRCRKYWT